MEDADNYGTHFVIGDASSAGLFQNSKRQTLKINDVQVLLADVQSTERAYAEWEYWPDVHIVKDGTGRGCLALVSKQLETAVYVRN